MPSDEMVEKAAEIIANLVEDGAFDHFTEEDEEAANNAIRAVARSAVRDAVREIIKEQEKRAEELEQDAGFYHHLGYAHEAIARRDRAQERKFVASALRQKFNIEKE